MGSALIAGKSVFSMKSRNFSASASGSSLAIETPFFAVP
jgi:hypothetical protein